MDVKTVDNEGIDVMCVILNKNSTNEKSLIQNFSSSGSNLDNLFNKRQDTIAVELFKEQYTTKLNNVKKEKGLADLYILSFVSTNTEVYIVCLKINLENMKYVFSGGFVNKESNSCVNINVSNFINSSYGSVKLYKSKKRMELRLKPEVIEHDYSIKLYSMN